MILSTLISRTEAQIKKVKEMQDEILASINDAAEMAYYNKYIKPAYDYWINDLEKRLKFYNKRNPA